MTRTGTYVLTAVADQGIVAPLTFVIVPAQHGWQTGVICDARVRRVRASHCLGNNPVRRGAEPENRRGFVGVFDLHPVEIIQREPVGRFEVVGLVEDSQSGIGQPDDEHESNDEGEHQICHPA